MIDEVIQDISPTQRIEDCYFLIKELQEIFNTEIFLHIPDNESLIDKSKAEYYKSLISSTVKKFELITCIRTSIKDIIRDTGNIDLKGRITLLTLNCFMEEVESSISDLELKINGKKVKNGKLVKISN